MEETKAVCDTARVCKCKNDEVMLKAMYKSELAAAAGVSLQTFRNWLQSDAEQLQALGVSRTSKVLPPAAVKYLTEKYVIHI